MNNRLIDNFIHLVQIDSETKNERAIADELIKQLEYRQFHVVEDNSARHTGHGAGNLIATLPGTKPGKGIFFSCHMDTVTPGKSIQPVIQDGYITSDGTTILGADDKAGIAVVLEAIDCLQEQAIVHPTLQFIISAGEESGLVGIKELDVSLLTTPFGYAIDSDGEVGGIVTRAPYQAKLETTILGKTAHAGIAPEKGVSAITIAARSIAAMKLGRIDFETTANIGKFHGGQANNIVCDYVELLAEARSMSEKKIDKQIHSMIQAYEQVSEKMGGQAKTVVTKNYPGFHLKEQDPVVVLATQAIEAVGRRPKLMSNGGGSDGNLLNAFGFPTAILSVGYEKIHTTEERIAIEELEKLTQVLIEIIKQSE